jgi:hypothetical protein
MKLLGLDIATKVVRIAVNINQNPLFSSDVWKTGNATEINLPFHHLMQRTQAIGCHAACG